MIASGAFARPSPILSTQAAHDLHVLRELPAAPGASFLDATSLGDCLRQVAADAAPLGVRLSLAPVTLPAAVARELADCAGEALRNVTGTQGRMRRRYGSAARVTAFLLRSGTGGEGLICCRCLRGGGHQGVHLRADVGGRRERRGDEPARCGHHGRLAVARVTARQPSAVLAALICPELSGQRIYG
jgi:hypothetical protein